MGVGSSLQWTEALEVVQEEIRHSDDAARLLPMILKAGAVGSSDHASFLRQKIPALFFTTGAHADYHRPTDDSDSINFPALDNLSFLLKNFVSYLGNSGSISYNPDFENDEGHGGRDRGYGAFLGCIPEFTGLTEVVGVKCSGLVPSSPAVAAGMQEGDIIRRIGEIEIKNLYDLAFSLKYYRAGDRVLLQWMRQDTSMNANIMLLTRPEHH